MPERPTARLAVRPDASRRRAIVVAIFLCVWMVVIGVRLVQLQWGQHERLSQLARGQQQGEVETKGTRGLILDRAGRELARTIDVDSFFAVPGEVKDIDAAAASLARALTTEAAPLAARLKKAKASNLDFVWIARKVGDEQSAAIRALNLGGVYIRREPQRRYPNGAVAAHVIGFVGTDDKGLAGVEQFQNASLVGEAGELFLEGDARRRTYESVAVGATPGQSVVLTIDLNIQYQAERILLAAVERARAKSGTAIVLNPRTGEILALANAPTFNPDKAHKVAGVSRGGDAGGDRTVVTSETLRNDALQNIYEPGSTFKIVAYSAALEEKLAKPDDRIDCQMGAIVVAGRRVRDHTAYGSLTLTEAMAKSSNVAAIKLGLRVGNERMFDYMTRFGFGARTGVELPGETKGLLRPVKRWQASSMGSLAIGQEIGVTPLQMAAAFGVLANDGVRVAPHIVRETRGEDGVISGRAQATTTRVVSRETAHAVRMMLESVTVKGTARAAQLDGYTAAGKTGTAQKIDPVTRGYSKTKHVASFVGFAPVENPSVVIAVVIDEPVGAYHGGDVAAPIFREIAEVVLPYLNVMPDTEFKSVDGFDRSTLARNGQEASTSAGAATADGAGGADDDDAAVTVGVELPEVAQPINGVGEVVYASASERALLMPDLRGRSVRDAARICAQLGLVLEAAGDGRARKQFPEAGTNVETGQVVRVDFER